MSSCKQASLSGGRVAPVLAPARGFTLVELMVALALSTFLLGGLVLTYVSGRTAATDAENLSRLQENMRFVSDHLLRDVRNAGFRDQLTLTWDQYRRIGQAYAESDGSSLTIRYAGRSHCAQARQNFNLFAELAVIENTYSVQDGRLQCTGRSERIDPTGTVVVSTNTVDMVNGVAEMSFVFERPELADPANVCNFDEFDEDVDLEAACTGVRITLTFQGIRVDDQRQAALLASFRNVLVDRIYGRDDS